MHGLVAANMTPLGSPKGFRFGEASAFLRTGMPVELVSDSGRATNPVVLESHNIMVVVETGPRALTDCSVGEARRGGQGPRSFAT